MKIAIAGYGAEGQANYMYWSQQSDEHEITVVDEALAPDRPLPEGVPTILGPGAFGKLSRFDLVVRTAGLAPHKITTKGKIWSSTNEFFKRCPAPIIGVTGTKGKGTTATLIADMLRAAGKTVWLMGNIGVPSLGQLRLIKPEDIVVYELSSFQLWDIEYSPHVAVVLMIDQDHQDVHESMEEYVHAKSNIVRAQTVKDSVVFTASNAHVVSIAKLSQGSKYPVPSEGGAHVLRGAFYFGSHRLCPIGDLKALGMHNLHNACVAIQAAATMIDDMNAIAEGIRAFRPLPHRLAHVAVRDGIDYYDDSISTTPSAAIAALKAFEGRRRVIMLGGSSKGSDFAPLVEYITSQTDVIAVCSGPEGAKIAGLLNDASFAAVYDLGDAPMQYWLQSARDHAAKGDVVILSPACASFDQYGGYTERGDAFIAAVESLR